MDCQRWDDVWKSSRSSYRLLFPPMGNESGCRPVKKKKLERGCRRTEAAEAKCLEKGRLSVSREACALLSDLHYWWGVFNERIYRKKRTRTRIKSGNLLFVLQCNCWFLVTDANLPGWFWCISCCLKFVISVFWGSSEQGSYRFKFALTFLLIAPMNYDVLHRIEQMCENECKINEKNQISREKSREKRALCKVVGCNWPPFKSIFVEGMDLADVLIASRVLLQQFSELKSWYQTILTKTKLSETFRAGNMQRLCYASLTPLYLRQQVWTCVSDAAACHHVKNQQLPENPPP